MPIPQLSRKVQSRKDWQKNKKYYLNGKKKYYKAFCGNSRQDDGWKKTLKKKAVKYFLLLGLFACLFMAIMVVWASRDLPDPNRLLERQVAQSTKIYDRTGENILYEIHGEEKRTLVALNEIPEYIKQATVAIEDKDFYKHKGFSFWAMFRTALTNILRGQKAGGSTLTQQLIKNAILTNEKTYTRKIKEVILAYRLEKKFNKEEILQMYLNEIPYGSTAYGIEAASQRYFGKTVKEINLPEAAILAALPQAPSRYSPYGPNRDLLIARQHYILDIMYKQGYISEAKMEAAKKYQLKFKENKIDITAPHFVMYVKEMLAEKYGEKAIEQGGFKIYTTLDLYKQKIAEEVIQEKMGEIEKKFNATNAGLVSIDPKNGQVLAMVGSRDYFNEEIDGQVNVATSLRQPGSSLKPLVYSASFIKGYTPDTVLYDVVTDFSTDPQNKYEPKNYDGKEHGPVTIKKALAGSLNIPAVKTIYLAGIDNVINLAKDLGYSSLNDPSRFGLSLVLGGGEVKLLEHTNAFSAFAREGVIHSPSFILKIEDKDGKVIEEFKEEEKRVFETQIARQINDILSDNSARAFIFGEQNWLTLGKRPVAAKTGTTNDYHDAWTIGYTPSLVTGVWVGNFNNQEMKRGADGSVVAAPIWNSYMQKVLGDTPIESFKSPEKIITGKPVLDGGNGIEAKIKIDRASGLLATEYTPPSFIEEKIFQQPHCILYYVNKDDPRGDPPKNPEEDPQFSLWESRVQAWAEKQSIASSAPPAGYDNLHIPENKPTFSVVAPANNQIITEPFLSVKLEKLSAPRGVNRVEYYLDDNLFYVNRNYPFEMSKSINFLPSGFHGIKVKACDDIDNCSESEIDFNLILKEKPTNDKIELLWQEPADGKTAEAAAFPLVFKIKVSNYQQAAKINLFSLDQSANSPALIATIAPIEEETAYFNWNKPPAGAYKIYAEAYNWSDVKFKSREITITVK